MSSELSGVVGITTKYLPCDEDGAFDEASYRRMLNWMVENGVGGIGQFQGHVYEYSDAERKEALEICVDEVDGRVPVVGGVASWDLETAVKRAQDLEDVDVDVLYVVGPPLDRPYSDDPAKIVEYMRRFADEVERPIMYCNSPAFWPQELSSEILLQLDEQVPEVDYLMNCSKRTHEHQEVVETLEDTGIDVLNGKSYNTYHQLASTADLSRGTSGITGYLAGTLPAEHAAMWDAYEAGDLDEAARIWWNDILPVVNIFYGRGAGAQANPPPDAVVEDIFTGFSYMLTEMGVIDNPRNPFSVKTVSEYTKQEVDRYLEQHNPSPNAR